MSDNGVLGTDCTFKRRNVSIKTAEHGGTELQIQGDQHAESDMMYKLAESTGIGAEAMIHGALLSRSLFMTLPVPLPLFMSLPLSLPCMSLLLLSMCRSHHLASAPV